MKEKIRNCTSVWEDVVATNEKCLSFFEKILRVINEHPFYLHICLTIIYQNLEAIHDSGDFQLFLEDDSVFLTKITALKNREHGERVLQIFLVYNCNVKSKGTIKQLKRLVDEFVSSNEMKTFFKLAFLLIHNRSFRFCYSFEEYLRDMKKKIGNYYKILLQHDVRLLVKITNIRRMNAAQSFIFQKFPYVEVNSPLTRSFEELEDFQQVVTCRFIHHELEVLESMYREFLKQQDYDQISFSKVSLTDVAFESDSFLKSLAIALKNLFEKGTKSKKSLKEEFKLFLFARNITRDSPETVFETILSQRSSGLLIEYIWEAFKLPDQILSLVSVIGRFTATFFKFFYYRKTAKGSTSWIT